MEFQRHVVVSAGEVIGSSASNDICFLHGAWKLPDLFLDGSGLHDVQVLPRHAHSPRLALRIRPLDLWGHMASWLKSRELAGVAILGSTFPSTSTTLTCSNPRHAQSSFIALAWDIGGRI